MLDDYEKFTEMYKYIQNILADKDVYVNIKYADEHEIFITKSTNLEDSWAIKDILEGK